MWAAQLTRIKLRIVGEIHSSRCERQIMSGYGAGDDWLNTTTTMCLVNCVAASWVSSCGFVLMGVCSLHLLSWLRHTMTSYVTEMWRHTKRMHSMQCLVVLSVFMSDACRHNSMRQPRQRAQLAWSAHSAPCTGSPRSTGAQTQRHCPQVQHSQRQQPGRAQQPGVWQRAGSE